jgi:hypothetical protein
MMRATPVPRPGQTCFSKISCVLLLTMFGVRPLSLRLLQTLLLRLLRPLLLPQGGPPLHLVLASVRVVVVAGQAGLGVGVCSRRGAALFSAEGCGMCSCQLITWQPLSYWSMRGRGKY